MVSILLAVYNGEKFITKSIESVLNQTYKDFELLIGFNGTTDNSKEIANSFNDERIKIYDYGMELGKSKTLNKLIKNSNGEFVCIQDDDDIWLPNKLEAQILILENENIDVLGTKILYCNEEGKIIGKPNIATNHDEILKKSLKGINQLANTTVIFRKKDAISVNLWDEKIDGIEDYDFWLKLLKKGLIFKNIDSPLVLHRLHQKSNFNTKKFDIKSLLKKYQ